MKRGRNEFGHDFAEKGSGHKKKRKPSKRPSIPAKVRRQVLFESGNRCAVCGVPLPLELAHIIPFCVSQDHAAENLICLCANCHALADHERWGERLLRLYKDYPCVLRNYKDPATAQPKMTQVKIRIDFEYEHWEPKLEIIFQHALAAFLEIPPHFVKIKAVRKGSIQIDVMLPKVEAERLIDAYEGKDQKLSEHLSAFRFRLLGIDIYRVMEIHERLQEKDVPLDDIIKRLCTLCYTLITITVPGSIKVRNRVSYDGWLSFLKSLYLPARNPVLNKVKQFAADVLVPYKLRVEKYNEEFIQQDCIGISPVLVEWPTLSEEYLARLSLWLVDDINLRIGLAVEHSLDLDREIIDHLMKWGNHREEILNKAKSEFISNCEFFRKNMRDKSLPHYLLSALLDEDLDVPSCKEPALIKTDLDYCHTLIKMSND